MAQEQLKKQNPFGTEPAGQAFKPVKRKAPASGDVLQQLNAGIQQEAKQKDDVKNKLKEALTFDRKKKSILERCGCL